MNNAREVPAAEAEKWWDENGETIRAYQKLANREGYSRYGV